MASIRIIWTLFLPVSTRYISCLEFSTPSSQNITLMHLHPHHNLAPSFLHPALVCCTDVMSVLSGFLPLCQQPFSSAARPGAHTMDSKQQLAQLFCSRRESCCRCKNMNLKMIYVLCEVSKVLAAAH